jgi:sortase A
VNRWLLGVERLLLVVGTVLVSWYLGANLLGSALSRVALAQLDSAHGAALSDTSPEGSDEAVEFSLWDARRVRAYKDSLLVWTAPPMAVLSIEKLRLRVPVFEGTGELALNRGAGWIVGTATPGASGNVGIAGHRDGFFRGLKDLEIGDRVSLTTPDTTRTFTVDALTIVSPSDVHVLEPRSRSAVTLVTCYPFYFVGSAPRRYIVHASIDEPTAHSSNGIPVADIQGRSVEDRQ